VSTVAALTGGYRFAFGVSAALVLAALIVAATIIRPDRRPAAAPTTDGTNPPAHRTEPVLAEVA
jgi:hypothetical protein